MTQKNSKRRTFTIPGLTNNTMEQCYHISEVDNKIITESSQYILQEVYSVTSTPDERTFVVHHDERTFIVPHDEQQYIV